MAKNLCKYPACGKQQKIGGYCQAHFLDLQNSSSSDMAFVPVGHGRIDHVTATLETIGKVKKLFEKSSDLPVWEWVRDNVRLPAGDQKGYKGAEIDFDIAPDMREALEWLKDPVCERIVLCWSAQSGKTLYELAAMCWLSANKKENGLFYLGTNYLFETFPDTRIKPILKNSNVGYQELKSRSSVYMFDEGHYMRIGMAGNLSSVAEMSGGWLVGDEIDEITKWSPDPVEKAKNRLTQSQNKKEILGSTPKIENGGITKIYSRTRQYEIEQKCPLCNEWFVPVFDMFKFDQEEDYKKIKVDRSGGIECPHCETVIIDEYHHDMVLGQRWKCVTPDVPAIEVGFKKRRWNTLVVSWSDVCAKYLECKDDPNMLADFYHSWCAEAIDTEVVRTDMDFEGMLHPYSKVNKEIPAEVKYCTAGIDVGKHEIWLTLIGWSNDNKKYLLSEKRITREDGSLQDWEKVCRSIDYSTNMLEYSFLGDSPPLFIGGLFDSGYDQQLVFEFCKTRPLWFPYKGGDFTKPFDLRRADSSEKNKFKFAGMMYYACNSQYWEDVFQMSLDTGKNAGGFFLPEDCTERYKKHLKGSVRRIAQNKRGQTRQVWEKRHGSANNHLRDASYMAVAMGYIKNLNTLRVVEYKPKPESTISKPRLARPTRRTV